MTNMECGPTLWIKRKWSFERCIHKFDRINFFKTKTFFRNSIENCLCNISLYKYHLIKGQSFLNNLLYLAMQTMDLHAYAGKSTSFPDFPVKLQYTCTWLQWKFSPCCAYLTLYLKLKNHNPVLKYIRTYKIDAHWFCLMEIYIARS